VDRRARRALLALMVCGSIIAVVLAGLSAFFRATRPEYAYGDGALLELYTIHAGNGAWQLGPYSRFEWHHPGPLFFYALAPLYWFLESHTFALNAGAFAINVASLAAIAWMLVRWARPATACSILLAIAWCLYRVGDITISYWNPHVVVIPLGAFVLLCAGLCAGRPAALPAVVLVGSFLTQTHVSLAPVIAVLAGASLIGLFVAVGAGHRLAHPRSITRWLCLSAGLMVLAWWPPLAEEWSNRPGNLSKLARFFIEPSGAQAWTTSALVWGSSISAAFKSGFQIPTGVTLRPVDGTGWVVIATIQLLALVLAGRESGRRGDRFLSALCYLGATASIVSLWSITRIREFVADYLVFWVSVIGLLAWAALVAATVSRLSLVTSFEARPGRQRLTAAFAIVVVSLFVATEVAQFRNNTRLPPEEPARRVSVLTDSLLAYLRDQGARRPVVRISQAVWSDGAGIVVQLYKRGVAVMVPASTVNLFGKPLAPTSEPDAVVYVVDPTTHAQLSKRPHDDFVAAEGGVYVHAERRE
jgi:hypothetical protein